MSKIIAKEIATDGSGLFLLDDCGRLWQRKSYWAEKEASDGTRPLRFKFVQVELPDEPGIKTETVEQENIKDMVNRFLGWRLPIDFMPDGGISYSQGLGLEPIGTNLFTATQAEAMIRHVLGYDR